jgi:hypothetical protein
MAGPFRRMGKVLGIYRDGEVAPRRPLKKCCHGVSKKWGLAATAPPRHGHFEGRHGSGGMSTLDMGPDFLGDSEFRELPGPRTQLPERLGILPTGKPLKEPSHLNFLGKVETWLSRALGFPDPRSQAGFPDSLPTIFRDS